MPIILSNNSLTTATVSTVPLLYTSGTISTCTPTWFWSPTTTSTASTNLTTVYYNPDGMCVYTTTGYPQVLVCDSFHAKPIQKRQTLRDPRSAIKKALKLIDHFDMQDEMKIFLNGQDVEISHPDSNYKFVLTKRSGSLIYDTSNPHYRTPYDLTLLTKSNVYISKLCVYMKDTPILDTFLAMAMFIRSGNESLILEKANYYSLTDNMDYRILLKNDYPQLVDKLRLN